MLSTRTKRNTARGEQHPRPEGSIPRAGQLPARGAHPRCSRPRGAGQRRCPVGASRRPAPWPLPSDLPSRPPLTLAQGPGPSSLASAMLRPPSAVPARGAGPGVTPFQPPSLFSRGDRGRIGGCRGRPRAVPRQEGVARGPAAPQGGGGGVVPARPRALLKLQRQAQRGVVVRMRRAPAHHFPAPPPGSPLRRRVAASSGSGSVAPPGRQGIEGTGGWGLGSSLATSREV